jgi:hypothetical protein
LDDIHGLSLLIDHHYESKDERGMGILKEPHKYGREHLGFEMLSPVNYVIHYMCV